MNNPRWDQQKNHQLTKAQIANPQNHELIHGYLKALILGVVCYTAKANWNTIVLLGLLYILCGQKKNFIGSKT